MPFTLALIEDDQNIRSMFTRILGRARDKKGQSLFSEVMAFSSIEELVAYQGQHERLFDVYLTDNNLSETGLTGLKFIPKQKHAHPPCIIVLMSAVDIADQAKQAGADAFFQKGGRPDSLLKLMSELLDTGEDQ